MANEIERCIRIVSSIRQTFRNGLWCAFIERERQSALGVEGAIFFCRAHIDQGAALAGRDTLMQFPGVNSGGLAHGVA